MLQILFLDKDMVVCVKPAGVLSQDAGEGSMPQLLKEQLQLPEIYPVHRLDRDVGGVMVFACSKRGASALGRSVQEKSLEKIYIAVLCGTPGADEAYLEDLLFHDRVRNKTYIVDRQRRGVKDAKLAYRVLEKSAEHSLVRVQLFTGRTHQIRVQFAGRKLPLLGDGKYGGKSGTNMPALWACQLTMPHPVTGQKMRFTAFPPETEPWNMFSAHKMEFKADRPL